PLPPRATAMTTDEPHVVLRAHGIDEPVVRTLIEELNAELDALYPEPGANHFSLPTADQLLVAWHGDDPVGCGAVRVIEPGVAEIKRMYVRPDHRGRHVGGMVLRSLEATARGLGCHRLVLETGTRQEAAMALYLRHGFTEIPCWGEYVASAATSTCLAKDLH
ncbi:MAG: GNAT family N-acetyltransferase, partial [Acidimicrobiales bacterium]|nr:GNAT family N-acetyltransferase [Acidimicrobiales bacterium]